MKTLLLFALACAPIFAQSPGCTQITDTLYAPGVAAPITMTGTIDVSLGYTAPNGIFTVIQGPARQTVVAGILNICLAPGTYTVLYTARKPAPLSGNSTFIRYWTIPAWGGPFSVQYVESQALPTPAPIAWAQISAPPSSGCWFIQSISGAIGWHSC